MICSAKSFDRSASESEEAQTAASIRTFESAGIDSGYVEDGANLPSYPGKTRDDMMADSQ